MARPQGAIVSRHLRGLVGIACQFDERAQRYSLDPAYVAAIEHAGAAVVLLPWSGDVERVLELVDGLVLPGGADIDPVRYGEPDIRAELVKPERDEFEFSLVRLAVERDTPILGICRGAQVLNVALGGTLYTDVPTDLPTAKDHRERNVPLDSVAHDVALTPGSTLAELIEVSHMRVNSGHHQAIRHVAGPLRVAGLSGDGLIEAVEAPGRRFIVGVQWHPERRWRVDGPSARLFQAFVAALQTP
jgi:putative glutamine amidotransferase